MTTAELLPTRVMGLDLSLTATGVWWGNPYNPAAPHGRDEVRTPDRRKGEADFAWNIRRCKLFQAALMEIMARTTPQVVVVEITTHAHQVITRKRGTPEARREHTTRGLEFRAGLGLGRAIGWLDGLIMLIENITEPQTVPWRYETIEAKDAKLRVAGSQAASKGAVAARLFEVWGWTTDGWRESEIDALACAVAYLRTVEGDAKERTYRALAASQDAARKLVRSRRRSTPERPIESPAC